MVFDLSGFETKPVLGIIRGINEDSLKGVVEASLAGGLQFLEITLNTPNSFRLIKSIKSKFFNILFLCTFDSARRGKKRG